MLMLPRLSALDESLSVGVYLCTVPTDMRKGFDSLAALVTESLGRDPLSGDLFLFVSRSRIGSRHCSGSRMALPSGTRGWRRAPTGCRPTRRDRRA